MSTAEVNLQSEAKVIANLWISFYAVFYAVFTYSSLYIYIYISMNSTMNSTTHLHDDDLHGAC